MSGPKTEKQSPVILDYRCKRCGAPFGREAMIECTVELNEQEQRLHHCEDEGVGIGELVGFHEPHMPGGVEQQRLHLRRAPTFVADTHSS